LTWRSESFAYADSFDDAAARYRGLRAGQNVAVTADSAGLLVKPEIATRQLDSEAPKPGGPVPGRPAARAGELKVNDVLLHALHAEYGVAASADNLVPEILGDDEGEAFDLDPVFDRLRRELAARPAIVHLRAQKLDLFSQVSGSQGF
jgi:hypothetical protein